MKITLRILFLITLCLFLISSITANPQWGTGVTVSAATGSQGTLSPPAIVSDGAGGAISAFLDTRNVNYDIYAARVDGSGNTNIAGWTANGIAVCTDSTNQQNPVACSDGAGGIIVAWTDTRSGNQDIYAQKINSSGVIQWAANGVTVCVDAQGQSNPAIVSDGAGGAIIAWLDGRGGGDLYAQRIYAGGGAGWGTNGRAVCIAAGKVDYFSIVSTLYNGVYVAWQDKRTDTNGDIYAQLLDTDGVPNWTLDGELVVGGPGWQMMASSLAIDSIGDLFVPVVTGSNHTLVIQKMNNAGNASFAPGGVTVVTSTTAYLDMAYCAPSGADSVIVTWTDDSAGAGLYDVYAQRVSGTGTMLWGAAVAVCNLAGQQDPGGIIPDGNGGAIIRIYNSADSDNYVQQLDQNGISQWAANGIKTGSGTSNFNMAFDGAGGAVSVWGGGAGYDLFGQRFWSAPAATPTFTPSPTFTFTATQTPVPVIAPGWVDADGTGVESIVVSSLSGVSQTVNVQADSAGRANVLFGQNFGSGDRMYFLKWNGSSWVDVDGTAQESAYISPSGSYSRNFSFVFDSLENPCLAWASGDPYYIKWNGSLWVDADGTGTESIKVTTTANYSEKTRLGLDNSGNPIMAWCEGMPSMNDVWFLKWNGASWTDADGAGQESIAVTTTANNSEYVNMAVDASGNPHVVWSEQGSWKLQYLKWNGSEWVDIDGAGRESAEITATTTSSVTASIVIDGSGEAHIAWKVGTTNTQICYLRSMAGTWVDADGTGTESKIIATFSPLIGPPELELDGMYRPHMAYCTLNGSDYDVSYIRWNGSAWVDADGTGRESETVYNSGGRSWNADLDIDASGTAHLAWQNEETGQLMYLKYPNAGAPAATHTFTPTYTYTLTFSPTSTATQTPTPGVCNIGKQTTAGAYSFVSPNWTGGSVFTFGTGNLSEIRVNLLNAVGNVTAAVYDATGISGMAGNLIASSASQAATAGWNILAISGAIAAPGNYWIMIQLSGATNQWDSQTGVTASGCIADCSTYGNWPAALSPNGPTDAQMSVYAVMSSCNSTPVITSTYTYTRTPTNTPTGTSLMIDNFEDGNDSLIVAAGRDGKWEIEGDGSDTLNQPIPGPVAMTLPDNGSLYAIHFTGNTDSNGWGASLKCFPKADKSEYNVSAYTGIRFKLKSVNYSYIRFKAATSDTILPGCTPYNDCDDNYMAAFASTNTWQTYTFFFSQLAQTGYNCTTCVTPFDPVKLRFFEWVFQQNTAFDIWVDDFEFITDTPPTFTPTHTNTLTQTLTRTATNTPVYTFTMTPTITLTRTQTPLQTWTGTMTPTATVTQTPAVVPSATAADVPDEETYAGPNPSKDFVYLSYRIPKNANLITIEVYNFAGYKVAKVEDASITAGFYRIRLSLDKFASGVYYYIIKADYSDGEHVKFKPSKFLVAH